MELTLIGYFYLPIALWCFFHRQEKQLVSLLLVSTVLQAASVVDIKLGAHAHGLNPFMCTVGLLVLKMLPKFSAYLRGVSGWTPTGPGLLLGGYLLWAATLTLVMPLFFEGALVRTPHDAYSGATVPLKFSLVNAWQVVGLGAVAVMFAFPAVRGISRGDLQAGIMQGLLVSFIVVALANLYEQLAHAIGLPSLVSFWASNPGYNQEGVVDTTYPGVTRIGVPFTEPSYASAYLASFIGGVCMLINRGRRTWYIYGAVVLSGLVLLSTGGSTGLVATTLMVAGGALFYAARLAHNLFFRKSDKRSFQWMFILFGLTVVALTLFMPSLAGTKMQAYFSGLFSGKLDISNSGTLARLHADLHGFQVLKETYGLGLGLGSNRTSSFISSMLASVGVVGMFFFMGFVYQLMRDFASRFSTLSGPQLFALGAAVMMLLPLCLSIPDLNLPMLWAAMWVLYVLRPSVQE